MDELDILLADMQEWERRRFGDRGLLRWQQFDSDAVGLRKSRQKPGPKSRPKVSTSGRGKPATGGRPYTGPKIAPAAPDDEWRRRLDEGRGRGRTGGGAGGRRKQAVGNAGQAGRSSAPVLASRDMRGAIATGSQPAVVKLISYAAGSSRMGALLTYLSREGELDVEDENGLSSRGSSWIRTLADEWTEKDGRKPSNDVLRLSLVIDDARFASDDETGVALKEALPGHRLAWRSEAMEDGAHRMVHLVMSAAARPLPGEKRGGRIFDNRRSIAGLKARLADRLGDTAQIEVHGFAHGVEGVARYLGQVGKGGRLELSSVRFGGGGQHADNLQLAGPKIAVEEARDWKRDLRSQERRDAAHIVLSARPGTPKAPFVAAARAMLAREFADHQYVFALHEDRDHLHVHAVVRMRSFTGQRLDPRIQDFRRWREVLAEEARARDIPMDAVSRFERANPPGFKMRDIRRVERGVATENIRRRVDAVREGTIHVPVRDEGRQRAELTARAWSQFSASAAVHRPEPPLRAGMVRLYRAERPGRPSSSQPLFTRDRAAAARIAVRDGGTLCYIDITAAELHRLTPSRKDPQNVFVISRDLAATADTVNPLGTGEVARLAARAAVAAQHSKSSESENTIPSLTGKDTDMPDLQVMTTAFQEMDRNMDAVADRIPPERWDDFDRMRTKAKSSQHEMLETQETIEKKRGAIEGDGYVAPKPVAFPNFVAENRGDNIRYSHRKPDGRAGAIAFTDQGDRVEIGNWRDREVVLAAMEVASRKWSTLSINGTARYKAIAVDLAAEHGFRITNPELQDALHAARDRVAGRSEKAGISAGAEQDRPGERPADVSVQRMAQVETSRPVDDGMKIRPAERNSEAILAAMKQAASKWGAIGVNGTDEEKATAAELAVEHGIEVTNPELQDRIAAVKQRLEERRQREAELEKQRLGFVAAPVVHSEPPQASVPAEPTEATTVEKEQAAPVDDGRKIRPAERNRAAMTVAMKQATEKWGAIGVNGTDRDKAIAVEIAAEQGFTITNPELQEKLVEARQKVEERREKERQRESRHLGFVEGPQAQKTDGEIAIALESVREKTDAEAKREVRQAKRSAKTHERPIDGDGEDHAYRTRAEAAAATRADRALEQNSSRRIPADINQSAEIERQRQIQGELLNDKEANRQTETKKQTRRQRARQKQ